MGRRPPEMQTPTCATASDADLLCCPFGIRAKQALLLHEDAEHEPSPSSSHHLQLAFERLGDAFEEMARATSLDEDTIRECLSYLYDAFTSWGQWRRRDPRSRIR